MLEKRHLLFLGGGGSSLAKEASAYVTLEPGCDRDAPTPAPHGAPQDVAPRKAEAVSAPPGRCPQKAAGAVSSVNTRRATGRQASPHTVSAEAVHRKGKGPVVTIEDSPAPYASGQRESLVQSPSYSERRLCGAGGLPGSAITALLPSVQNLAMTTVG